MQSGSESEDQWDELSDMDNGDETMDMTEIKEDDVGSEQDSADVDDDDEDIDDKDVDEEEDAEVLENGASN